jgi:adenylate cyclase class 2
MATEIEIKARVDDPERLKTIFSQISTRFIGTFEKDDTYWTSPMVAHDVRVRQEVKIDNAGIATQTAVITYKHKAIRAGIEVNDELEFEVSNITAFERLLVQLGLKKKIGKHKQGPAWNCAGITAELFLVRDLGYFVELEIMSDTDDEQTVSEARKRLFALLSCLGIPEEWVEQRYYTEMLGIMSDTKNITKPNPS